MNNRIVVTSGDPSGIGPEICLDIFSMGFNLSNIIILADINLLKSRALLFNKDVRFNQVNVSGNLLTSIDAATLNVFHVECPIHDCLGEYDNRNAQYVYQLLELSVDFIDKSWAHSIVNAPISKQVINTIYEFTGHTEYYRDKFNCKQVVMMLANDKMRVALLTTHVALKDVYKYITIDNLVNIVTIINSELKSKFSINRPRIALCGVNPHAGEGGVLGDEELVMMIPAINILQNHGVDITGPFPADTIFNSYLKYDVIIASYHDQGLPVLKYSGFDSGINVTLGLPILRVSVDHGTALDIASRGVANSRSMLTALATSFKINQVNK